MSLSSGWYREAMHASSKKHLKLKTFGCNPSPSNVGRVLGNPSVAARLRVSGSTSLNAATIATLLSLSIQPEFEAAVVFPGTKFIVRVTVISTISSQPPMIADELRRQADVFIDLVELRSKVGRDSGERAAPARAASSRAAIPPRATTMAPRGNDDGFDD